MPRPPPSGRRADGWSSRWRGRGSREPCWNVRRKRGSCGAWSSRGTRPGPDIRFRSSRGARRLRAYRGGRLDRSTTTPRRASNHPIERASGRVGGQLGVGGYDRFAVRATSSAKVVQFSVVELLKEHRTQDLGHTPRGVTHRFSPSRASAGDNLRVSAVTKDSPELSPASREGYVGV